MNIHEPTLGDDPTKPLMGEYLAAIQTKAFRLRGIIEAINFLTEENSCAEGRMVMGEVAEGLAREISIDLDSVYLPKAVQE